MAINFDNIVEFSNKVRILNATPHLIRFRDGEGDVEVPPSGALVGAKAVETAVGSHGAAALVKTVFETSPAGVAELEEIEAAAPGVLVVGSIISAQAYPGRVAGMTPAPGFERVEPAQKRMNVNKFSVF